MQNKMYYIEERSESVPGYYDNKDKAQFVIDHLQLKNCKVIEVASLVVVNPGYEELQQGLSLFIVNFKKDGSIVSIRKINNYQVLYFEDAYKEPLLVTKVETGRNYDYMSYTLWAKDEEDVRLKVLSVLEETIKNGSWEYTIE